MQDASRRSKLVAAEDRALELLTRIEEERLVMPGRSERDIERAIYALAEMEFGVEKHWHKRIVRAGINTLAIASDNPPVRMVEDDDVVFLDLGPVFKDWEADVGYTYVLGTDPRKNALRIDLPSQFNKVRDHFLSEPDITGAALYSYAYESASEAGWKFAGKIAGHVVAEFPHARLPGLKQRNHISPENLDRLRDPDLNGEERFWILEIHLVDPAGSYGGFYERLMLDE